MVDRIKALCKAHKTNFFNLEKSLGFANGSIAKTKIEKVSAIRVKALADYFGVSMEYLMTGVRSNPAAGLILSPDELELIEDFRKLNENGREMVRAMMNTALWQAEGKESGKREA